MARVIVCGLGQVGYRTALLLRQLGHDVSVLAADWREEFYRKVVEKGIEVYRGDARSDLKLLQAGLADADALISCTDDDLTNIETALDARRLAPQAKVVIRLFDESLRNRLVESLDVERALAVSVLAAPEFAAAVYGAEVRGRLCIDGHDFVVCQLDSLSQQTAAETALGEVLYPLLCTGRDGQAVLMPDIRTAAASGRPVDVLADRKTLSRISPAFQASQLQSMGWLRLRMRDFLHAVKAAIKATRQTRLLVAVILFITLVSTFIFSRWMNLTPLDALYFTAATLTTTGYGDISAHQAEDWLKVYAIILMFIGSASIFVLHSIVTSYLVTQKLESLVGRDPNPLGGHVVLVGLGDVGYHTMVDLIASGHEVVMIEKSPEADYRGLVPSEVSVVMGDARDPETLDKAGIRKAKAIICVTQNDAVNLAIGLAAQELNPKVRTVLRMYDPDMAHKVQSNLKIGAALSPSMIAAPMFVAAALYPGAELAYVQEDTFFVISCGDEKSDSRKPLASLDGGKALYASAQPLKN